MKPPLDVSILPNDNNLMQFNTTKKKYIQVGQNRIQSKSILNRSEKMKFVCQFDHFDLIAHRSGDEIEARMATITQFSGGVVIPSSVSSL